MLAISGQVYVWLAIGRVMRPWRQNHGGNSALQMFGEERKKQVQMMLVVAAAADKGRLKEGSLSNRRVT